VRTIHKFEIPRASRFSIDMDPLGRVLSVQMQNGRPHMWVLLNSEMKKRKRHFYMFGTGDEVPNLELKFLATIQMDEATFVGRNLVMHLFEDMSNTPSLTDILWALAGAVPEGKG